MNKKILIFCNNYLGFTLLSAGGVLADLTANFDVTILTASGVEASVGAVAGPKCRVLSYDFKILKPSALHTWVSDSLNMTYAARKGRRNVTGGLQRKGHLQSANKKNPIDMLKKLAVVGLSKLAENSWLTRRFLNFLFKATAPTQDLLEIIKSVDPHLCVATTAGVMKDGMFFAASRKLGIPSLALIQSWDRTASKGYPAHHPDHCIVWNKAMAQEADIFLEIDPKRIYVEGSPPWDNYNAASGPLETSAKNSFLKTWNLDPSKKIVFIAINGMATHGENIQLIRDLCEAHKRGEMPNVQMMFRTHPAYLVDIPARNELEAAFQEYGNDDIHLMHPIVADPSNKDYVVTEEDRIFMHNMFRACDVTVSIMSTWMIESAIFDKPNICIEFGLYKTKLFTIDLSEYKAEHIRRIFSYDAVYRTRSSAELIQAINHALKNPAELRAQRLRLADIETGPNKGNARAAFLSRIQKITETL